MSTAAGKQASFSLDGNSHQSNLASGATEIKMRTPPHRFWYAAA